MIYRAAGVTTAGSTTLPAAALTAAAGNPCRLFKVEVTNTTVTGVQVALRRLSTTGTPGATIDSLPDDPTGIASACLAKNTYTSTGPTITAGNLEAAQLGTAVGSGWVWVFEQGLYIPEGTVNGIGVVPLGTGQVLIVSFTWEE